MGVLAHGVHQFGIWPVIRPNNDRAVLLAYRSAVPGSPLRRKVEVAKNREVIFSVFQPISENHQKRDFRRVFH